MDTLTLLAAALLSQTQASQATQKVQAPRNALPVSRETVAFAFRVQDPSLDILAACDQLEKSGVSGDRQFALYMRARWHHREYELRLKDTAQGRRYLDKNVLKLYQQYMDRYKSSSYIAEVRFYKAFAYLEMNKKDLALKAIDDLVVSRDKLIDLDDIIWTPRREFAVKKVYETALLKPVLVDAIKNHMDDQFPDVRVEAVAREVRFWMRYPSPSMPLERQKGLRS